MNQPTRPPLFFLFFFSIFGFIGIATIVHLWTATGFGAPPTFFKIMGSLIAIAFIAMGFGVPISALMNKGKLDPGLGTAPPGSAEPSAPKQPGTYDCPHCGANVGDGDVSPSGDLRCTYCNEWWNVHRR